MVVLAPLSANAQLLKKLGEAAKSAAKQGVETIKKNTSEAITTTAEILVGKDMNDSPNNQHPTTNTQSPSATASDGSPVGTQQPTPDADGGGGGAPRWGDYPTVEVTYPGFLISDVTDVRDGVFAIAEHAASGQLWHFYKIETAAPLSKQAWRSNETPYFDNGVCAVCDTTPLPGSSKYSPKYQWYILYKTGETKALDTSITSVGNFCDGLAVAKADGNKLFFINDKGERVLPQVTPYNMITYPLSEGTRRLYCGGYMTYGYLDAEGRVVIKPRFKKAYNFSSNHAIVRDENGKNLVIDLMGNTVSEIPSKYVGFTGTTVTSFVGGGAVALNNEDRTYDIVTPQMQVNATFDKATAFYNTVINDKGTAIVMNSDWKHPKLCLPNGRVVDDCDFFRIERQNPGDTLYVQPVPDSEPDDPLPHNLLNRNYWCNTGLRVSANVLVGSMGAVFSSSGDITWTFDRNYYVPDEYSPDGYALGIARSLKEEVTLKLDGSKYEALEDHYVFFDTLGNIKVEIVDKSE